MVNVDCLAACVGIDQPLYDGQTPLGLAEKIHSCMRVDPNLSNKTKILSNLSYSLQLADFLLYSADRAE